MAGAAEAYRRDDDDTQATLKLLCSHGGRFVPRGPDGALRYVGGETRALSVPRDVSFRSLAARLAEMAGAAEVRAIGHHLADDRGLEDVVVSATCDEELAHLRSEHDRLRATRPAARFRVFVVTTAGAPSRPGGVVYRQGAVAAAAGIPPPAPAMRRVRSEQALPARPHQHRMMTRRVQSAQELAGGSHGQPPLRHHRRQQCCCPCQRRDLYTPAPPSARPALALPYTSKRAAAVPSVPVGEQMARSRDVEAAVESRRAMWEFE
ncbi:hypothetical protein BS78_01G119600 [Paspalum vaginatum]|nr:hypothetical protein BS78_01G119600 [Paspalum vaginatum]